MDAITNALAGINALGGNANTSNALKAVTETTDENGNSFSDLFKNALGDVVATDYQDKVSDIGLITGTLDNIHDATIAAEKADIMLNLVVQVRNRMVEGYQEVMRMQM
ncbi:flagellar hook-basal body complex protein FliE [Clostridia bacterium]|nr:flagellar hook-basal body complex protein FliE [Clostridia bacterium]